MGRIGLVLVALVLGGCAGFEQKNSSGAEIAASRHVSNDAPYVSLVTMISTKSGDGAHSALLVNGSQVALYDPAGTFKYPGVPERGDVLYGITPTVKTVYESYHARDSHYVLEQRLPVTREFADAVISRMEAQGPSSKMHCAVHTSEILRSFDIWSDVPQTYYPGKIVEAFGQLPGVTTRKYTEQDTGQNIRWVDSDSAEGQAMVEAAR